MTRGMGAEYALRAVLIVAAIILIGWALNHAYAMGGSSGFGFISYVKNLVGISSAPLRVTDLTVTSIVPNGGSLDITFKATTTASGKPNQNIVFTINGLPVKTITQKTGTFKYSGAKPWDVLQISAAQTLSGTDHPIYQGTLDVLDLSGTPTAAEVDKRLADLYDSNSGTEKISELVSYLTSTCLLGDQAAGHRPSGVRTNCNPPPMTPQQIVADAQSFGECLQKNSVQSCLQNANEPMNNVNEYLFCAIPSTKLSFAVNQDQGLSGGQSSCGYWASMADESSLKACQSSGFAPCCLTKYYACNVGPNSKSAGGSILYSLTES